MSVFKKNYLSVADQQLQSNNIDLAIELYQKAISQSEKQESHIEEKIESLKSVFDFSKCCCHKQGFCNRYNKDMLDKPPKWKWCQNASPAERREYYKESLIDFIKKEYNLPRRYIKIIIDHEFKDDSISLQNVLKTCKTKTEIFFANSCIPNFLKQKSNYEFLDLYYLSNNEKYHECLVSAKNQSHMNKKIVKYILNQEKKEPNYNNIEILCLGHSKAQFDSIQDRPYLTKVNLNNIDAGKYSGNEWAESRAFMGKNLFSRNTDFVGLCTASWNLKYEPFNAIDEFEDWKYSKVLLNSEPEDNIVLCADIFCVCPWVIGCVKSGNKSILSCFFEDSKLNVIVKYMLKLLEVDNINHVKVPYSNQMFLHRSNYEKYVNYLKDNDILDKLDWLVKKYAIKYAKTENAIKKNYHNVRLQAYLMEMVTCFWFSKNNFMVIPSTERVNNWYSENYVSSRIDWDKK